MGMENDEITIDLMDLFQVVFKKLHLVLLAGIIAALVAVLVTKLFMTSVYTSTTKNRQSRTHPSHQTLREKCSFPYIGTGAECLRAQSAGRTFHP